MIFTQKSKYFRVRKVVLFDWSSSRMICKLIDLIFLLGEPLPERSTSEIETFQKYAHRIQWGRKSFRKFFEIPDSLESLESRGVPAVGGLKFSMAQKKYKRASWGSARWGRCHLGKVLIGGQA